MQTTADQFAHRAQRHAAAIEASNGMTVVDAGAFCGTSWVRIPDSDDLDLSVEWSSKMTEDYVSVAVDAWLVDADAVPRMQVPLAAFDEAIRKRLVKQCYADADLARERHANWLESL